MELHKRDLHWILRRIPKQVIEAMRDMFPGKAFLAGGFIRACVSGEQPADLDLFVPDGETAITLARVLVGKDGKWWTSPNALTLRLDGLPFPVQIIHRWTYTCPEQLIESFDFTIAKSAVWFQKDEARQPPLRSQLAGWQSLCHDDFYADLAGKKLVYTMPQRNEDAGGSMLRVLKFYQKGYRIPLDSLGAVMARMAVAVRPEALQNPGSTPEEVWARVLTGLLHEVDPLQNPYHVFHLPSDNPAIQERA